MKNFVQEGMSLDFVAPSGGVIAGVLYTTPVIHVANTTAAEGEPYAGWTAGVYELPAETHATTQGIDQGGAVYWDVSEARCTKTADGNVMIGTVANPEGKASTAATVKVKLQPSAAAAGAAIADISITAIAAPTAVDPITIAAVTGVDGVGDNAASKADVDAAFAAIVGVLDDLIVAVAASASLATTGGMRTTVTNKVNAIIAELENTGTIAAS